MKDSQKKTLRIVLAVLGAAAVLILAALGIYRLWEKPPELAEPKLQLPPSPEVTAEPEPSPTELDSAAPALRVTPAPPSAVPEPTETPEPLPEGEEIATNRQDGVITILLVGNDNGNGNTDTIILGKIDTVNHQMDFVSIPRDTLINSPWRVRRINTVYWGTKHGGGDGLGALKWQVSRLTGFQPDCVAVIDLQAFMDAVDLIGGVYFDVPMAMDYEDWTQDLYIHLEPGYQLLDGYQAMCLCRFRSGYITGDLGRIEMQQQFLSACSSQFLSLGNIPRARQLLELLSEQMDTDLSLANMAYLLRQYQACDEESIRFHTAPCTTADIAGCSYVLLRVDPWLELINEYLNPYDRAITSRNVDIVYSKGGGEYGCTGRLQDPDYYKPEPTPSPEPEDGEGTEAELISPSPSPSPAPSPSPSPAPSPSPSPAPSPEPSPSPSPAPSPEPSPSETPEPEPSGTPEPDPEDEEDWEGPIIISVDPKP